MDILELGKQLILFYMWLSLFVFIWFIIDAGASSDRDEIEREYFEDLKKRKKVKKNKS